MLGQKLLNYEELEDQINEIGIALDKINKQMIQARYYYSEKGIQKLKRQNEKRRNKTKFKRVLKELRGKLV